MHIFTQINYSYIFMKIELIDEMFPLLLKFFFLQRFIYYIMQDIFHFVLQLIAP